MKVRSILFFLSVVATTFSWAQVDEKTFQKKENNAIKTYEYEAYEEAIPLFEELAELKPDEAMYPYYIGVSYMRSTHHERALPYLLRAYANGFKSEEKPEIILDEYHDFYEAEDIEFNLARAYHLHESWEEAIEHYELFKVKYDEAYNNKSHDHDKEIIQKFIQECKSGMELVKNPVEVKIENLGPGVNSDYEEITPFVDADESVLIYTARNPNTTGGARDHIGNFMEDIYIANRNEDGTWGQPRGISDKVNTIEHDACAGLSPDGNTMFVYRNNNHNTGDLYITELKGEDWSRPEKMQEGINTKYLENSATISADGQILFFTSTRPGGLGGEDIYMADRKADGSWGNIRNLGPEVNTPFDDDAPFLHPDGKTLFFSSKGHTTMGGFDIFKVSYDAEEDDWGEVENLGHPINTPENDIFFVFTADGEKAYYSSHRAYDAIGGEDLYVMYFKQKVSLIHLYGFVTKDADGMPLEASITVTDNSTGEKIGDYKSNSKTGKFTVILPPGKNYGVHIEGEDCVPFSENIDLPDIGEYYEKEVAFKLNAVESKKPTVTILKNVFFDTEKWDLRKESFSELEKYYSLLKDNPALQVEIAGHTDTDGGDSYNLKLSQKRAQSVVDYFTKKGLQKERFIAVGYGEEHPIAANDTEVGKQQNRRTELIVHDTKEEGVEWVKTKGYYYDNK